MIGRSGAASRPGGASSPSSSRQRTSAVADRLGDALDPERPRGRASARPRAGRRSGARPGWRGSRPARPRRTGGWRRSPASRRGRRPRPAARRRRSRRAPRGRRRAPVVARCSATAQRTAATALEKVTISPSPRGLDLAAVVRGDDLAQHREVPGAPCVALVVAVAVVERRRSDDVGEHDRDERRPPRRGASSPLQAACHPSG